MQANQEQAPSAAPARRRRRAFGPPGANPTGGEPRIERPEGAMPADDDERLLRDRPPHHDQGV